MPDPVSYIRPVSFPELTQPVKQPAALNSFQSVLQGAVSEVERS